RVELGRELVERRLQRRGQRLRAQCGGVLELGELVVDGSEQPARQERLECSDGLVERIGQRVSQQQRRVELADRRRQWCERLAHLDDEGRRSGGDRGLELAEERVGPFAKRG